jgi:type IX secretion system PorP/SprF family membrane protein
MSRIKYYIIMGMAVICLQARAQGDVDMGQKWLCYPLLNPATIGNDIPSLELNLFGRQQWLGVDGAPTTELLFGQYALPDINSGVGLTLSNEVIGMFQNIDIKMAYAYHVRLNKDVSLSFGLAADLRWISRIDSKIELQNPSVSPPPFENTMQPNIDAGIELSNQWLSLGLSAVSLFNDDTNYGGQTFGRTFHAYLSGRFNAGSRLAISPSVRGSVKHGLYDGEVGAVFYYRKLRNNEKSLVRLPAKVNERYNFLWAGVYSRFSGSLIVMAGVSITEQWRLGYAYEHTFALQQVRYATSHELMVSWQLPAFPKSGPRRYR